MPQWEYLDVYIIRDTWADSAGREGQFPRLPQKGWGAYIVPTPVSNELGAQGWELTGVVPGAGVDIYILLFKRPRQ
jgi:hypothetical protein